MQEADDCATLCPSLSRDLIYRILESLPPNYLALICRLVCKDWWRRFTQPQHCVARFGLPLPPIPCYAAWLPHLQQYLKQLTFCGKLQLLSAAASSGSEVNLEVAWSVLRPCLALGANSECLNAPDAGAAAVKSGHLHVLPWLLQHGCPLDMHATLEAAAAHCDLAGLQRVWELLGCGPDPPGQHEKTLYGYLAHAAASSSRDAVAKLTWLMAMADMSKQHYKGQWLLFKAAAGAASSGRLPVLQWLLELASAEGVPMEELWSRVVDGDVRGEPMAEALRNGHVAVADWLVDEAGYPLPQLEQQWAQGQDAAFMPEPDMQQEEEQELLWVAAAGGGCMDSLRWLLRSGVPACPRALLTAARAGHLEAVRFLHEECGVELQNYLLWEAASSRSIPTVRWLLQAGCTTGAGAYGEAARVGDGAMIRWLAQEAGCPWLQDTIPKVCVSWADEPGNSIDELKEAVQLLLDLGCPCDSKSVIADGAAASGRLPLLRYLHEELGIGFGQRALVAAARGGCEAVLEWLVGAGCRTGGGLGNEPYVAAGCQGDMATLQCLLRLGVPWHERVVGWAVDVDSTPPSAVRWLVEQGAPCGRAEVAKVTGRARREGRWQECAEWLAARLEAAEHGA